MEEYNDQQREAFRKLNKVKSSKSKGTETGQEEIDRIVDELIQSMNDALIADRESNKNKQYALRRLQLANKVYPELRKQ
jgi:regulator of sigma D